jgi:uncharacterized protein (DUF1778 family)
MPGAVQISAPVSKETKALLEAYAKATGIKKGYLIEAALRYHLRALEELPSDVLVPPRLTVSPRSFEEVVARLERPGEPSPRLRRVMHAGGD